MALALYRRHRRGCKAGHREEARTSEYDERKKGFRRCECLIFVSGSLDKKFRRQTTGRWEWDEARAIAARWESAGSWDAPSPPFPATEPVGPQRIGISAATEAFMIHRENRGVAPATLKKYKTFCTQLCAYTDGCGYVFMDQLSASDMDTFFASWKDNIRSKAKKLERLKGFLKFCIKRKWLSEDIASDLEAPEGSSLPVPKAPFTDDELNRIYAACDAIGAPTKPGPGHRNWSGEDAKDFIFLSVYTGLRISDVATFDISKRLTGNDVFLRMHKTKKPLSTWIPDWLVMRLKARQEKHGSLIFRCGVRLNMRQLTEIWRGKRLSKVFELAGPFEENPTPHRFRHTFVRILLEKGVPVSDVAELIGDDEKTLKLHYSKWVKTRQDRLTKILREAFDDKPKPKLVVLKKG
jgi:integrase/recombinase XerD